MPKPLRELFVNRSGQTDAFHRMLDGRTRHRIMLLTAGAGMGKSWLLRMFAHEAHCRNLPLVQIDFAEPQTYDMLTLVRRCRDALGAEHFHHLTQVINDVASPHISLAIADAPPPPVQATAPTQITVNTDGGDYAQGTIDKREGTFISAPIINNSMFVLGTNDVIKRMAIEDRINTVFFDCLAQLSKQTTVVFLFDTYERTSLRPDAWVPQSPDVWIGGELLTRIRDNRLANVVVVLAGRRMPEFDRQWNDVIGYKSLDLLDCISIKEYVHEKLGLLEVSETEINRLWQAIAGNPQLLGVIGDNLIKANKPVLADDDW
jgi:hypothetical protein